MKITLKLSTIVTIVLAVLTFVGGLLIYIHNRDMMIIEKNTMAIEKSNSTLIKIELTIKHMGFLDSIYADDIEKNTIKIDQHIKETH